MANQPSITNVVPLRPPAPPPAPVAVQSAEMALSMAILSALSIGSKRDRKLFQLVGWELGRLSHRSPGCAAVADANDIFSRLREVNYGR